MIRVLLAFVLACLVPVGLLSDADAQQSVSPRTIGVLLVEFPLQSKEAEAFRKGLRDAGYTEGRDLVIEWRSANGDYARIPELVAELIRRKPDLIVVDSTPGTQAAKRATSTIPIVMAVIGDPVGSGVVSDLARPGGNITGLSTMVVDLSAKRLQLLKEAFPQVVRVTVLWDPATTWHSKAIEDLKAAAPSLSIQLSFVSVRRPEDIDNAFLAVRRAHAQALYVLSAAQFGIHRRTLLKQVSKARLPSIYEQRHFPEEGGLISYGANYADQYRRSAEYVDKILKGAKPGDLPIEQPTQFELVVNLKTAKALGITIPESILLRADEVIR